MHLYEVEGCSNYLHKIIEKLSIPDVFVICFHKNYIILVLRNEKQILNSKNIFKYFNFHNTDGLQNYGNPFDFRHFVKYLHVLYRLFVDFGQVKSIFVFICFTEKLLREHFEHKLNNKKKRI